MVKDFPMVTGAPQNAGMRAVPNFSATHPPTVVPAYDGLSTDTDEGAPVVANVILT